MLEEKNIAVLDCNLKILKLEEKNIAILNSHLKILMLEEKNIAGAGVLSTKPRHADSSAENQNIPLHHL